jgi:multiple sugar transport system permease protein
MRFTPLCQIDWAKRSREGQGLRPAVVLTKGRPGDHTKTTVFLIYETAFQNLQFGYASAMSVVLFALLLIITGVQFVAARKWVFYS